MLLICLSLAWLLGITAGYYLELSPVLLLCALLPLGLLPLARRRPKRFFTARKMVLAACLLLLFFGAAAYSSASAIAPAADDIGQYNNSRDANVSGEIREPPQYGSDYVRFRLDVTEVKINGDTEAASGGALVYAPAWADLRYGDRVVLTGDIEPPPHLDGFDYRGYLAEQGITAIIYYPETSVISRGHGNAALTALYTLRNGLSKNLARVLAEPEASLAQGIILGIRANIPDDIRDSFSASGTAHLLAISGLHISVVTLLVLAAALRLLGRRHYIYVWLTLALVWLYAVLTGLYPPALRAAIMVSLFLLAELLGRQRSILAALCFTAAIMTAFETSLLRSASFQMSFAAMLGLIFITPRLQTLGQRTVKATLGEEGIFSAAARLVNDLLAISLGAVLAVWPLVAWYFGIVAPAGPLATLLALPLLPVIIILGMVTAVTGYIALPLSQFLAWLTWPFLAGLNRLAEGFAATGLAAPALADDSGMLWWLPVYYLLLAAIIIYLQTRHRRPGNLPVPQAAAAPPGKPARFIYRTVLPVLLLTIALAATAIVNRPDDNYRVTFLDVGQGDAILIRTPAGHDILVDGGSSPADLNMALGKALPFWDRRLEMVVITHPHSDHCGGLVTLGERYRIDHVIYTPSEYDSPSWQELVRRLENDGIMSTNAAAGQLIPLGEEAAIEIINPPSSPYSGTSSDVDNNAVVLKLSIKDISFLLTADLHWDGEYALLRRGAVTPITVLKIPHHGADTSTTAALLAAASPAAAVISAGAENDYGHPDTVVMERLAAADIKQIYRTDLNGNIVFVTDGHNLTVQTER